MQPIHYFYTIATDVLKLKKYIHVERTEAQAQNLKSTTRM